jgi:hypothetical protein
MRRWKWREGKVRPVPGISPHDRLVSRGISSSLKESLRRSLPRHCFPHLQTILGAQYAFLRHVGIYLVRCGFRSKTQNQTLGWDRVASRWSAPSPGSRTCREDHAPSHRPQMSSDRLFLDRVARQHCPSPLHRQAHSKTVPGWGTMNLQRTANSVCLENRLCTRNAPILAVRDRRLRRWRHSHLQT